jgi:hypothetical protein
MVCYLAYETNAPAASTWGAIATLFLIHQAVVLGRVFLRVALVGAERHYDLTMRPTPVPDPPAAFVPAVAVATSPAEEPPSSADSVALAAAEVQPLEPPRA